MSNNDSIVEDSDIQEFNEGHIIEGCDRLYTATHLINDLIVFHPAVIKADVQKQVEDACSLLFEAYQGVSSLDDKPQD